MRRTLSICAGWLVALGAGAAAAAEIPGWPCNDATSDPLTVEAIWGGALPADGHWQDDADVRAAVVFATEPENAPDAGIARLKELGHGAGDARKRKLALAVPGLVERGNLLRGFIMDGIRTYSIQARIVGSVVKENDAALAALPKTEDNAEKRRNLQQVRKTNFLLADDAEEEAEFLCHRLAYVEKKLRRLTAAVKSELAQP